MLNFKNSDYKPSVEPDFNVLSFEVIPRNHDLDFHEVDSRMGDYEQASCCHQCQPFFYQPPAQNSTSGNKLNKALLRKLDRKFDRLFKGKMSSGRLTNASKSVYSFEGEVLSEEEDEYNSDSSIEE